MIYTHVLNRVSMGCVARWTCYRKSDMRRCTEAIDHSSLEEASACKALDTVRLGVRGWGCKCALGGRVVEYEGVIEKRDKR